MSYSSKIINIHTLNNFEKSYFDHVNSKNKKRANLLLRIFEVCAYLQIG